MMNGWSSFWGWWKSEAAGEEWNAWRGTNTGFDQSVNSATYRDTPTSIKTGANQTLTPALVDDSTDTFYAPSITRILKPGLVSDDVRTNLLLRSQELDNAAWTANGATVTANATTAPDGSSTAEKLTEGSGAGTHFLIVTTDISSGVTSGVKYTLSVYAKAAEKSWFILFDGYFNGGYNFQLSGAGTVGNAFASTPDSASITNVGGGWYRCSITFTTNTTQAEPRFYGTDVFNGTFSYTGDGTSGVYFWGAQLERADGPTSYIATTSAAKTVSGDLYTAWDPAKCTGAFTLSNNNRTFGHTGGGNNTTRAKGEGSTYSSQKVYVEYVVNALTNSVVIGFTNTTGDASTASTGTNAFYFQQNGHFSCPGNPEHGNSVGATWGVGDRLGLAFDTTTGLAWMRVNGGAWNSAYAGTQNPATGQGGVGTSVPLYTSIGRGPYYGWLLVDSVDGDLITANFASSSWADAAPSGFTELRGYVPQINRTVKPGLYTNSTTFYAPLVTPGAVTEHPSLYTNTNVFYAPNVVRVLKPGLVDDSTDTFYAPTVSQAAGTTTLHPSLVTNSQTVYSPTVTAGVVTLHPALYSNSQTLYAPTVHAGAVTLHPALYSNSQTFYAPTVTNRNTLFPSFYTNSQTFFSPTVHAGAVTLHPALYVNSQTFYAPTIKRILQPGLYSNANTFYSPTVTAGAVTLHPSLYANTQTFYAPTIRRTLLPALYSNSQTFYAPTVTSRNTLLPSLYANSNTFYSPTITAAGATQTLRPSLYSNAQTFYQPTVLAGAVTLRPSLYTNTNVFYAPTVSRTVLPSLYADADVVYAPTVSVAVTTTTLLPSFYDDADVIFSPTFTGGTTSQPVDRAGDAAYPWEIAALLKKQRREQDQARDKRWAERKRSLQRASRRLKGIVEEAQKAEAPEPVKVAAKVATKTFTNAARVFVEPPPAFDREKMGAEILAASKAVASAEAALKLYAIQKQQAIAAAAEQAKLIAAHALAAEHARIAQIAAEEAIAQTYAEAEARRIHEALLDQDDEDVMLLLIAA